MSFVIDCEFVEFDKQFKQQISRTQMAWMSTGDNPKQDSRVKIFVHDLIYINGQNVTNLPYSERWKMLEAVIQRPIKDRRYIIELTETIIVDDFHGFEAGVNELCTTKVGRSTEGVMAKAGSFKYSPDEARTSVVKLKNRIEIDALIIGYQELPKPKSHRERISSDEAMRLRRAGSGTFIFRMALLDERTGKLVPIEAKRKLSERDLKAEWNEDQQRWEGLDDPKLWTMFFNITDRMKGEYAYGNSYAASCNQAPDPGTILTISPMEITMWEDHGLHISFQHPIPVGIKTEARPGTIQSALIAHQKVLPEKDFAVLIDVDYE